MNTDIYAQSGSGAKAGSTRLEVFPMAWKKNRSDPYQYRIVEITIDPALLSDFSSEDSLGARLSNASHSEEVAELRRLLMRELRRLIKNVLTDRQQQVIMLRMQGKTQVEIAELLHIHQTTVHKTLSGNIDYKNKRAKYGGAIKKLKKMCSRDERILNILKKIEEARLREEDS